MTTTFDKSRLRSQLYSVQYLRGFAALTVVFAHAFAHPVPTAPEWTWFLGRYGVTLFFVISGFIMVTISPDSPFDPREFLVKRILRIAPLYWTITVFTATISIFASFLFKKTIFDIYHLVASLLFIPMYRPGTLNGNGPFTLWELMYAPAWVVNPHQIASIEPFLKLGWTLNYEMFFYIIFSSLAFLKSTTRCIVLTLVFLFLVYIGRAVEIEFAIAKFYTGYDLLGFVFGVWIGWSYKNQHLATINVKALMWLSSTALIVSVVLALSIEDKYPDIGLQIALCIFCSTYVVTGLVIERSGRLLFSNILALFGNASYSIYLVHMFAIVGVSAASARLFEKPLGLTEWVLTGSVGFIVGAPILGLLTYRFIERPLNDITKKWLAAYKTDRAKGLKDEVSNG